MSPDDDYFNKAGKYLGSDNAETDNVQVVSQKDWDENATVDNENKGSISKEKGAEISSNITETKLSNDAVLNIVEHYNEQLDSQSKKEGVNIEAKALKKKNGNPDNKTLMESRTGGGGELLGFRYGESNDIIINTTGGTVNELLNTASNIKNTLVHEYQHQKDRGALTEKNRETRAVKTQKAHSTYSKTTPRFQKNTDEYGKIYN